MPYRPVSLFGLTVPPGDEPVIAVGDDEYPCTFRITMAAVDPSAVPVVDDDHTGPVVPRAILKMIRLPDDDIEDDEDDEDEDYDSDELREMLGEDSEDDEDAEAGPSDPAKSPKALRRAALLAALGDAKAEISSKGKGKKAVAGDADEADESEDEDLDIELDSDEEEIPDGAEEFVICTLDPTKQFQQPLDITINEHERVLFSVSGTHAIYLTGNVLYDEDERSLPPNYYDDESESEDDDVDPLQGLEMSSENDEDMEIDYDSEEDDLDDLEDPRVKELEDDEEEVPALVPAAKGKNKRAAEEPAADATLSKSQLKKLKKKLKDNEGNAVAVEAAVAAAAATKEKGDKKVQFAKTLVQGPTASTTPPAANGTAKTPAVKVVQGVTVDDKKVGGGPQAKSGDRVSMRYIGKLETTKKVFDSNKKGAPFSFRLGGGEVIKGWDIGVAGMQVGGERRITIPAHLAYGSKGMPGIPSNSTLVFDLKLLEIKK